MLIFPRISYSNKSTNRVDKSIYLTLLTGKCIFQLLFFCFQDLVLKYFLQHFFKKPVHSFFLLFMRLFVHHITYILIPSGDFFINCLIILCKFVADGHVIHCPADVTKRRSASSKPKRVVEEKFRGHCCVAATLVFDQLAASFFENGKTSSRFDFLQKTGRCW